MDFNQIRGPCVGADLSASGQPTTSSESFVNVHPDVPIADYKV